MKWWRCCRCDAVFHGLEVPDKCPVCGERVFSYIRPNRRVIGWGASKRNGRKK